MKLLIRRDVNKAKPGKPGYTVHARVQLTDTEAALIQTNQLEGEMLLHFEGSTEGPGSAGALLRVMRNLTVKNLTEGMTFSGEHLYLLRDIEAHVLQAAKNLKRTLDTAQTLGRETLVDIDEVVCREDEQR